MELEVFITFNEHVCEFIVGTPSSRGRSHSEFIREEAIECEHTIAVRRRA